EMLSDVPALNQFLVQIPAVLRLQLFLQQAAIDMQVVPFLLIALILALFAFVGTLAAGLAITFCLTFAVVGGATPFVVAQYKRQQRFARFEEQFPDAMELLSRAVRAGHAFTTAFSLIAEEMADPVAEEFRATYQQQNLGLPLRDALQ